MCIRSLLCVWTFLLITHHHATEGKTGEEKKNMFLVGLDKPMKEYPFPALPFAMDAMEPSLDAHTMNIHYKDIFKEHTVKLNKLMKRWRASGDKTASNTSLIQLWTNKTNTPKLFKEEFFQHGAAYLNHLLYFSTMSPPNNNPGKQFPKKFNKVMERSTFNNVDELKAKMKEFVGDIFSSGWVYIVRAGDYGHDSLTVMMSVDEMSPMEYPLITPILAFDVWEHSYVNKYGVNKLDYFEHWWNTVDWIKVEQIFDWWRKVEGYVEKNEL